MAITFNDLNLNPALRTALEELGYTYPTAIQQKAFAPIMAGKDVLGIAQTGTGKTYAYLLPLIRLWQYNKKRTPEILVLVPTRELVVQVVDEFEKIAKHTSLVAVGAYGGTNIKTQITAIQAGAEVVVATPGRLVDLLLNGTISTKLIKKLVIDEVDEMLNAGFRTQLKTIIDLLPERRQNLMFSATITEEIDEFINKHFGTPVTIEAAPTGTPHKNITQIGYRVPNFNTKVNFLQHLLSTDAGMTKVLVFAGSKRLADELNSRMEETFEDQLAVIHSNKTQNTRLKTVEQFESGACRILIASDLIARGLDVTAVSHVINMDVPIVAENYMHRIGRTGRADQKGIAITFITEADKEHQLKVEALMGKKIPMKKMPEEVEVSTLLTLDEEPSYNQNPIKTKRRSRANVGASFHEKLEKNKKVNNKITRATAKKLKYGKRYDAKHGS